MNEVAHDSWPEANQRYLTARLRSVRLAVERHAARAHSNSSVENKPESEPDTASATDAGAAEQSQHPNAAPWALDLLSEMFHLSRFEQNLLLLCAGMEFDASFPALCAA